MKIIQSKLRIPNYSPSLKRDRLFSYLEKRHEASIIEITSESGYGKTTLVSSYIREKNIPAVWYELESSDRYAHVFLTYLKAGLYQLSSKRESDTIIQPEDVETELEAIVTFLSNRSEPLIIVLDDYHLVDQSSELEPIINKLFTHCSSMVTFIILSRVRPNLPMKLKIRRPYKEISTSVLAFTRKETHDFFNTLYDLKLEDQELDLIYKATEGWAASYQLLFGIINKMNCTERAYFWSKFPNVPHIFDYLSTEVLELQDERTKQFLYKTSLLSELDPAVIEQFLAMDDAEKFLTHLLKHHLFIFQDDQGIIRYHPLFRQFLYQSYKDAAGGDAIAKDHLALASIYENMYQFVHAFAHSTIGQDYPKAVKLMNLIRDRYNPIESMIFLDGWLEEISPGQSLASNTLFLIRCIPLSTLNELITYFEQNISILKENNNQLWICSLQHRLGYIYFMSGEIIKAKKLFKESLKGSKLFHDHPMTALNLTLIAEVEKYLGNYSEALQSVRQSLFISEKYSIKHTQLHALDTIATIYIEMEKLDEAASSIQQALDIATNYDHSSLAFVYTTMGSLFQKKEDITKAIEWGTKAVNFSEKYNITFDVGWSHLHLGESFLADHQWENAERCLSKAFDTFSLFTHYRGMVILSQIKLYEKKGDTSQASKKRTELLELCNEHNFHWMMDGITLEKPTKQIRVAEKPVDTLSIRTLGNFRLYSNGQPIAIKRNSSVRLLQYLITNRKKKINKDILLEDLFPGGSVDSMNNQLYVSLSILRKSLEPNLKSGIQSRYIVRSDNHYLFNIDEVHLDIEEFSILISDFDEQPSPQSIEKLLKAEQLYTGDYFEEYPYETFLESEREKLRSIFFKMMRNLARYYYTENNYEKCFEYFEKILNKDPYQEHIYFEYIERLLQQNFSLQANNLANKMINYMEKEMGIDVQEDLQQLFTKFQSSPVFIG
ncbi:tetratricopeptide repeat protein [Bacillus sp. B190/17]|uniref:Tetratricopeptide repeat protein n=1 Tax=Bacillus lumedeiriae TaxID=3058829 RepID=A0ABW8I8D9_9BACI